MIVKLVSFPDWDDSLSLAERKLRIKTAAEIINAKDSDFVMFSEWILTSKNDLKKLAESVHNKMVIGQDSMISSAVYTSSVKVADTVSTAPSCQIIC